MRGPKLPTRLITRLGTPEVLGKKGMRPMQVSALRKPTFTPAAMAACTFLYICRDQYSSWPTDSQPFARSSPLPSAWVSTLLT